MSDDKSRQVYGFYINLDERGEYYADVRNLDGDTVWEMQTEAAEELVEDGFIKDIRDPAHIEQYLKEIQVIEKNDVVLDTAKFEKVQARYLANQQENVTRDATPGMG